MAISSRIDRTVSRLLADSGDVTTSNCVINLSGDKPQVLREAARVLMPGGRFAVSDVIADPDMNDETKPDMAQYTGCIADALTRDEFTDALRNAGLVAIETQEIHRVHPASSSAVVRAAQPNPNCSTTAQTACCAPGDQADSCDGEQTAAEDAAAGRA